MKFGVDIRRVQYAIKNRGNPLYFSSGRGYTQRQYNRAETTQITESVHVQFRAEAFNAFNTNAMYRQQFNTSVNSALFGASCGARWARRTLTSPGISGLGSRCYGKG